MGKKMDPEEVGRVVGNVKVTFPDTDEVLDLKPREESVCVWVTDQFPAGEWMAWLRLDFSDMDERGHPTLDADFFKPGSTKPDKKMRRMHPAHHTEAEASGPRTYIWEFENVVTVRFTAAITWSLSATMEATSSVSIAPNGVTVIHADGSRD